MNILPTKLSGVIVAETVPVVDPRGAFARLFCERELSEVMGGRLPLPWARCAASTFNPRPRPR